MHATTRSHRLAVFLVVAFVASGLAGCIRSDAIGANDPDLDIAPPGLGDDDETQPQPQPAPSEEPGETGNGDNQTGNVSGPGQDPADPAEDPRPDPTPLPASWTVTARDARAGAWEAPQVEAEIAWGGAVQNGSTVRLQWTAPDGTNVTDELDPDQANGTMSVVRGFAGGIGAHDVQLNVTWTAADGQVASRTAAITLEVFEALRVIADASTSHTSGQNVFREDRLVAFAPWDSDSAHDLIHRMGDTYGFSVASYYREDLDSWFVDAINGTEFQWAQPEILGISYNWMLLVNGEKTQTAADDTFPELGDVVEFRYVKCYSTGQCDGT